VRFYSVGNPAVGFRDDGVMFALRERSGEGDGALTRVSAYMLRFGGSNAVSPEAREPMPLRSSFFIGDDPGSWRTDVPSFGEVVYRGIYNGIDLSFHTTSRGAKYEFTVRPGADLSQITLAYEGMQSLTAEGSSSVLRTELGEVRDTIPYSFQESGGEVSCAFAARGQLSYGFECAGWDGTTTLVIDPLIFSTFLGGTQGEYGTAIKIDSSGNAYVTGYTWSLDFPTTPGSYMEMSNAAGSAFVTKVAADGSSLIYSTYLGGVGIDVSYGLGLDSSSNAIVAGYTESTNFPTTPGAYNRSYQGSSGYGAVFVSKLNASGTGLIYSTFLGTGLSSVLATVDRPYSLAVDPSGNAYVAGHTSSDRYPTTAGAYDRTYNGGVNDVFLTKLNSAGGALVFSTFLGGSNSDHGMAVAVDVAGSAYVTGFTASLNFPTTGGAFQTTYRGGTYDCFVTKFNAAGSGISYSTFVGSSDEERAHAIAVDSSNNAYITGWTWATGFPTTGGAYDTSYNGNPSDAFVTKLNAAGNGLSYSSYIGGIAGDAGYGITVDSGGIASVTGSTGGGFPTAGGAYDTSYNGGTYDVFLTRFNAAGSGLTYSSYFGGTGQDEGYSVAVRNVREAYFTGDTWSSDFPTSAAAFDRVFDGARDGFVTRIVFNNVAPTANAGPDFNAQRNLIATLDGSASSDPDGDSLTYIWAQTAGSPTTITNPTSAIATIRPLALGPLTFRLTVSDGYGGQSSDTVIVTVVNTPPVANAGTDIQAYNNTAVNLDGTASSDLNNDPITFQWTQTAGPAVALNNPDTTRPWFVPHLLGVYTFRLNVSDGFGGFSSDTVNVNAINRAPVANAGLDRVVASGTIVNLDGSLSFDPDSDPLTFRWVEVSGPFVTINNSTQVVAWIQPSTFAGYRFLLEVKDGNGGTSTDVVNITVANLPPIANAGPDQNVPRGVVVNLDGGLSSDPDGSITAYRWTQTAGPGVTLSNATTPVASFVSSVVGFLTFKLNVTDDKGGWGVDIANITVFNSPPTANAGPDKSGPRSVRIDLNGSMSSDPDGTITAYEWIQISGSSVTLYDSATVDAWFIPSNMGSLRFQLTVTDSDGATASDLVDVTVVNLPPTSKAGPDQNVKKDDNVTLDGLASSDPDGDTLTFSWAQVAGPIVILYDANTATPNFTASSIAVYTFNLTVNDGNGGASSDLVSVSSGNLLPIANAGPDQNAQKRTVVTLDGVLSSDADGDVLAFSWTQIGGPIVTLSNPANVTTSFTPTLAGLYRFSLSVDDGNGGVSTDTVDVTVTNRPPVAEAGPDGNVAITFLATLYGTGSSDPDVDPLSFDWRQTAGTPVLLIGANTATPTFTPTVAGSYTFELTVDDGDGGTSTDSVTVNAINGQPPTAIATVWPDTTGYVDTVFVFDGANSSDPDGTVAAYSWDLDDSITKLGVKVSHTFHSKGHFFINLTVTDNVGLTDRMGLEVFILNRRPVITSHAPSSLTVALAKNQTQTFAVVASDPDGDSILHSWRLNGTLVASGSFSRDFSNSTAGIYILNITVSDGSLEDWLQWTITVNSDENPPPPPPDNHNNTTTPQAGFPVWIIGIIAVIALVVAILFIVMKRRKPAEKKEESKKQEKPKPVRAKNTQAQQTSPVKPPAQSPPRSLPMPPPPPPGAPPQRPPATVVPPPQTGPPAQK